MDNKFNEDTIYLEAHLQDDLWGINIYVERLAIFDKEWQHLFYYVQKSKNVH